MKRTSAAQLIGVAVIGAALGALLNLLLAAVGQPLLVPALSLAVTLILIAAITVALAVPIYRAVRATPRRHVDPFHAMRILVLGKADALSGALLTGFGLGLLGFMLSRAVLPGVSSWGPVIAASAGALLLCVAGMITEHLCTLPKDTDDDLPGAATAS
ncbi:DUF3180 family protein [Mycetocola spongiae]|uniref:DUF3180 family protein n=1 Tax=Mycetocola spongiae TaxID=2859226 RepID=UPI001CF4126D|nr:DUF3180 family protein [Mycetocola spongiae]UCR88506.1 DUF3180 domain-containing protein [Mycetocola spongiae]